jgi:hypothetical protein
MNSDIMHQILQTIEAEMRSRPTAIEFEMAYQARVAIDRIRFAIKHIEKFGPRTDQMREATLQLLHALQRLETVDRRFQEWSQVGSELKSARTESTTEGGNGQQRRPSSHGPTSATCDRSNERQLRRYGSLRTRTCPSAVASGRGGTSMTIAALRGSSVRRWLSHTACIILAFKLAQRYSGNDEASGCPSKARKYRSCA